MSRNLLNRTKIKRLEAGAFLMANSFLHKKGRERTNEKNIIDQSIRDALSTGELISNRKDEIDVVEFCRWASTKRKTKNSQELRWPWLKECLNLPMKPIISGGVAIEFSQLVVPSEIEACQRELAKAWRENVRLQKELNLLTEEVEDLRVKRKQRVERGKIAASKQ